MHMCRASRLRGARHCITSLAVIVAAVACGGSDARSESKANPVVLTGAPEVELPSLEEIPEAQRAAFEDNAVSTAEYTEAFDRFLECANATSELVIFNSRDAVSGYIQYGYRESSGGSIEDPTTPLGRCNNEQFFLIELAWQLSDPTFLQQGRQQEIDRYANEILPCLIKNNIEAPATYDGNPTQQWIDADNEWYRLYQAGKC